LTKKLTPEKRQAQQLTRQARKLEIRLVKQASARRALDNFGPGMQTYCITHGQFSLAEVIAILLEKIGPADAAMSTWTAGAADLNIIANTLTAGNIKTMRLIVDCSFGQRHPAYLHLCRELYGDEAIRSIRTHLKFVVLTNDEWNIVLRTSMNLNENPRVEYFEVSDDKELADFFLEMVDTIFEEEKVGDFSTKMVPVLKSMQGTRQENTIKTTTLKKITVGKLK
jgi:hypothetical protein